MKGSEREARRLRVVDLALFGPDRESDELPLELDLATCGEPVGLSDEQAAAEVDHLTGQMSLFIDSFPPEDKLNAIRGMYIDADGSYRTSHQMLRAI